MNTTLNAAPICVGHEGSAKAWIQQLTQRGVILRDFSPEVPALSEVEGIWRVAAHLRAGGIPLHDATVSTRSYGQGTYVELFAEVE